ncbi:snakin-2-like isoform X1 [Nymphaea colorata]|nr:snakin-2-like isoform X1 [Nymphaea colorata]
MALRYLVFMSMLAFCIILQLSFDGYMEEEDSVIKLPHVRGPNRRLMEDIDCDGLCAERCKVHSRPNVCTRACGTCCVRCRCVPPGTWGNKELCGKCYTDMTTHGNKTKCPASLPVSSVCPYW